MFSYGLLNVGISPDHDNKNQLLGVNHLVIKMKTMKMTKIGIPMYSIFDLSSSLVSWCP